MKQIIFLILVTLILALGCESTSGSLQEGTKEDTLNTLPDESNDKTNGQDYVVSTETYQDTFAEIEALIEKLNKIISDKNYSQWRTLLTDSFITSKSDPETLKEYSEQPILKKYNIVLKNLNDYFIWVVSPSRSDVRLDEIIFLDENHVKAIMYIDEKPVILYMLEKIDDKWKIGN